MGNIYERLKNNPYLKSHLDWEIAICQHMMYLLIDEDRGEPVLGERKLPWGAPDAETYVKRIERNLRSLEKVADLRLTYQIAAVDMESIARDFPEVAEKMKYWHQQGRLDFVGGSFSQPHMQGIGSESNWRQFEWGVKFFNDFFGKQIKLHGRQETALHQQISQILKKNGFEMISMPIFPWSLEIIEGSFEFTSCHLGTNFMRSNEFVEAVSLDGTSLPAYLTSPVSAFFDLDEVHEDCPIPALHAHNPDNIKRAISSDLYGPPPVWPYFPDLMEIDQSYFENIHEIAAVVHLEEALARRIKKVPPRAKAKLNSYWSYYEGQWAEEFLRNNKLAEEHALLGEAIQCMAKLANTGKDKSDQLHNIWHTILKYQHHDANWIEITDLRRKGINYLKETVRQGQQIMLELAQDMIEPDTQSLAVFNSLAHSRKALIDLPDDEITAGIGTMQKYNNRLLGLTDLPAGGFKSFSAEEYTLVDSQESPLPKTIETKHYRIDFSDNGLINQIISADQSNLLNCQQYLGGEIRAMINDQWQDNRKSGWSFYVGDVCYILERTTSLGDIPLRERYFFFRETNAIKVEMDFDFSGNEVGFYWLDETKINIYYPTRGTDVYHDIPFGYIQSPQERPLFATNWVSCGGLTYVNRGTVKHWVKDGVIANVIAWGSKTFDNRIHFDFWTREQTYDLRLYNTHTIEYFLIPAGTFDANQTVRQVEDLITPVFIAPGKGQKSFYEVQEDDLAITSLHTKEDKVQVRGYQLPSQSKNKYRDFEIFNCPAQDIARIKKDE